MPEWAVQRPKGFFRFNLNYYSWGDGQVIHQSFGLNQVGSLWILWELEIEWQSGEYNTYSDTVTPYNK